MGLSGDNPPDNSRDPSTWDRYTGTYRGRFYGWWKNLGTGREPEKLDGEEIEALVTKVGRQLIIDIPLLSIHDRLLPIGLDNFFISKLRYRIPFFGITFIDDAETQEESKWIRHRQFVLARDRSCERLICPRRHPGSASP